MIKARVVKSAVEAEKVELCHDMPQYVCKRVATETTSVESCVSPRFIRYNRENVPSSATISPSLTQARCSNWFNSIPRSFFPALTTPWQSPTTPVDIPNAFLKDRPSDSEPREAGDRASKRELRSAPLSRDTVTTTAELGVGSTGEEGVGRNKEGRTEFKGERIVDAKVVCLKCFGSHGTTIDKNTRADTTKWKTWMRSLHP